MRMFIWESVDGLTDNWHDGGAAVVVAPDLERARERLRATARKPEACEAFTTDPDRVFDLSGTPAEEVFIFANAGCC